MTDKILYTAVILTKDAQRELFALINSLVQIPADWRRFGHHMTVAFGGGVPKTLEPGYFDDDIHFGMECIVVPVAWKMDDKGIAVQVISTPMRNRLRVESAQAHITVAVAPGISPVYSNKLLESGGCSPLNTLSTQPFLKGYLLKVLPGGRVSPETGDLADDTFVGN